MAPEPMGTDKITDTHGYRHGLRGKMDIRSKLNLIIAGLFLVLCVFVVYFMPRAKYTGKAITADILDSIPLNGRHWQGRDIDTEDIGDKLEGEIYNFISRIFARQYINSSRPDETVFLVVLDAGNFHYPKVCFQGAGFSPRELPQRELNLQPAKMRVHLLLNEKARESILSIYWICIDKKIVPTWAEQKLKQLYYSLFNKKRVGLMVRVDVPVAEDIDEAVEIARDFLNDLYQGTPPQYRDYIFGAYDGS